MKQKVIKQKHEIMGKNSKFDDFWLFNPLSNGFFTVFGLIMFRRTGL